MMISLNTNHSETVDELNLARSLSSVKINTTHHGKKSFASFWSATDWLKTNGYYPDRETFDDNGKLYTFTN